MSCERGLNFDQWKTFSENHKPIRVCYGLFTNLPRIIVGCDFSPSSFKLKRGILPRLAKYISLSSTGHIKLKCFLWTKLLETLLLAKYLISVTAPLKLQSCKLYNNKYKIVSTQITNTEIFSFMAVLAFKIFSRKFLFTNGKDNRNC